MVRSQRARVFRFGGALLFREQIASGGPLTVTHPEITATSMTIRGGGPKLVAAAAGLPPQGGEVFLLDMGGTRCASLTSRRQMVRALRLPTPRDGQPSDGDISNPVHGLRPARSS